MSQKQFNELGLSKDILSAVEKIGYATPTEIQEKCIPLILEGRDVIGHSQTGTGKTMAFGLPAVDMVDPNLKAVQVLILCPTRELALQATGEINKAIAHKHGVNSIAIFGGSPMEPQTRALRNGTQIVVGTPGRIMDHMRRRTLKLNNLMMLVLDEADEMLNMGFREDIEVILESAPEKRITVLFSATMSKAILKITKNYQTPEAKLVKAVTNRLTVASIDQWHVKVARNRKIDALKGLIALHNPRLSLVFCNTKRMVDEVAEQLQQQGLLASALHGDLTQHVRNRVMNTFRSGALPILVATDVAARGIDVDDIDMVFNFDIPQDEEYYVHRVGRTGRAGRSGLAVTFVSGNGQMRQIKFIERYIKTSIPEKSLPTQKAIQKSNRNVFIDKVRKELASDDLDKYARLLKTFSYEGYSPEEVACALFKMTLGKEDIKIAEQAPRPKSNVTNVDFSNVSFKNTGGDVGMVRFFLSVGTKDKVAIKDIVGAIAGESGIRGKHIGKVNIHDKFSFVEVVDKHAHDVFAAMSNSAIKGRKITIEPAKGRSAR